MSEIVTPHQVAPAQSQLPVSWYFDERIFELEKRLLFDAGPGYAGHELMVPQTGCYRSQEWNDHANLLIRNERGVDLVSNICRHRQAIMLKGSGQTEHIVCPLHRWTYQRDGRLLGAPHFADKPCLDLSVSALESWNGLLFKGPRRAGDDLAGMNVGNTFDFSGYTLDHVEIHECNYNWKTFIEVYLEDYHVEPFHPGLGNFVTCDDLTWQFGDWYSVQQVGITALDRPGSTTYRKWHDRLKEYCDGELPAKGAIWLTYYPGVMVEWYPSVLVVSTLIPTDLNRTTNVVEFYYPEEIAAFERELVEAEQAAYMETAVEDDDIAERMDAGRHALWRQGRNEVGPYQSPFEDGMQHFHEFYRRIIEPHL